MKVQRLNYKRNRNTKQPTAPMQRKTQNFALLTNQKLKTMKANINVNRTIHADYFSELGNSNYLYRFIDNNGKPTELVCLLCDDYLYSGKKIFKYVLPENLLQYRNSPPAIQNTFVQQIFADNVEFVQEVIVN